MGDIPKKMVVTSFLEKNLIFQNLMKLKEPLNISINAIEYKGQIERYDSNTLIVKMTSPYIGDIDGLIRTNFIFHNNYHYFDSRARQLDGDRIILDIPTQINKNMLRKYERVYVLGNVFMKMKIMIQSEKYDFKSSSLLDERVIFKEVKKPRPAIDKILNGIKQLVSGFSQVFQLKVFKPGQKATLEENLIKETKKIFLIYDSYEDNIKEKRFFEEGILTIGGAYAYITGRGDPVKAAEGKLLDLLQQKRNQKIFSECYVPLLLEGEAVGYIRLINTVDYHRSIKPAFAIRTINYANILIEALVKYDYFRLDSGKEFEIPVINISAGGLLFKLDESSLKNYIIVRTILQMSIRFPERQVETRGVVYRIDEEASEYGLKFQEINENDIRYIESIVKRGISL